MNHSLLYLSHATLDFDAQPDALRDLAHAAASFNATVQVTGFLYFKKGVFIQYIEGPDAPLAALMERIANDSRHAVQQVIRFGTSTDRVFANWSMRHVSHNEFVQIQLEDVLEDLIGEMSVMVLGEERVKRLAQNMVRKVAQRQIELDN